MKLDITRLPADDNRREQKVYGRNAVRALFANRRFDLVRVYIEEEVVKEFGDVLQWCARNKKAYHVVKRDDLEKIAKSTHHEGVMVLARAKPTLSERDLLTSLVADPTPLLLLDRVGNPHNIGAFARTAAHFGVKSLLVSGPAVGPSPSMARVAQGGLEYVDIINLGDPQKFITRLKALGYSVIGTSSQQAKSIYATSIPKKSVLVFGNEVFGVSKFIKSLCDETVSIPGTGKIESLNVSVACGIILSQIRS